MECRVDKNKIKSAINETVTNMVTDTELFNIVDGNVIAKRNPPLSPTLTEEQEKLVQEAKTHVEDIDVMYRPAFLENTEDFLRFVAEQANSSESEQQGALTLAGYQLFEIALKVFPEEGKLDVEAQAIKKINDIFIDQVLLKTGPKEWGIAIPDNLVMKYIMSQEGTEDMIVDFMRQKYLSQFSSTSLNLINPDLWLNHPILEDPTIQKLLAFAKKINPNFRVQMVDDTDLSEHAVSLIRDHIIIIRQGSIMKELPEEIAHFFVELMPDDHPTKKEMMEKIVDLPIYSQTYQKYKDDPVYQKNSKIDIYKIKREAVAKQIGEYIQAAYRNEADSKYGKKRPLWKRLVQEFFKFLRKMFHQQSSPIYTEPLVDVNSIFNEAAGTILQGDVTSLNLEKVPSIYDSVFFSKIEDNLEEGFEASNIAKSLYEFSQALKRQIGKTFYKYVVKDNMKALKEMLDDPKNKDSNKIWEIASHLEHAAELFKNMRDDQIYDQFAMANGTSALAEVYREMEQIPQAIRKALAQMSKDKTENQLLDNIVELQTYFQFSDTFNNITDEFISLLGFIRTKYPQMDDVNNIYDTMVKEMGSTEREFRVVDLEIMNALQDHIINLTHKWTDVAFSKYRGMVNEMHDAATTKRLKNEIAKKITDKITGIQQIRQAVTGKFPDAKNLVLPDGGKVNIRRIKDLSQIDYIIFMFSSPTLMADPFVSNVMAYFTDKYVAAQFKGMKEAKLLADQVLPIMNDLSQSGVGWYEAQNDIQQVQPFYDTFNADNKTEKRVFLSSTNRFQFQYDKQIKIKEITTLSREIDSLQSEFQDGTITPEREAELKTLIEPKQKELQEKRDKYNDWLNEWSNRAFIPDFYKKQAQIKASRTDSDALKELKDINRKLILLEQAQFAAIMYGDIVNQPQYDSITLKMANLQNRKRELQDLLPQAEEEIFKLMEEIYEVDEVNTSRLRQRHKNKTVKVFVDALINAGTDKSRAELEHTASEKYDGLYDLYVPKKEFYELRAQLFEEVSKITRPIVGLESLNKRWEELRDQEKKLLKPFRDSRGEISISSFKYLSIEKYPNGEDKLLSQSLKDLEEEMDMIKQKMDIYSRILSSTANEDEKQNLKDLLELLTSISQVINNHLTYKAEDVQRIFDPIAKLTKPQAEQILSAIEKALQGNLTEFANLGLMDINASSSVKFAFSKINFSDPQTMLDYESQLVGAFKYFARLNMDQRTNMALIFDELNKMYTNGVSVQYYAAMSEFFAYMNEYLDSEYRHPNTDKEYHAEKSGRIQPIKLGTVDDIEKFLGDGLFEAVIGYMQLKHQSEQDPTSSTSISVLIDYFTSIHKQKTTWIEGEAIVTYSPISYVRKPIVDPALTEKKAPRFLTRNKIRDSFRTVKHKETDSDVIDGTHQANVDINGEWLPLEKEGDYWNQSYNDMKMSTDPIEQKKFQLLETLKMEYLKKQQEYLVEGEMLDLVIPAKHNDKLEEKKLLITKARAGWDYIRNITPFAGTSTQEQEQNYMEDIGAVDVRNVDIYTGAVIAEKSPKLSSRRRIPLARTSKDALSSVVMFVEDVNEYSAKNIAGPIMKSFSDVFKYAHEQNPTANKFRKGVLTDLYLTKVLGEVPKNYANDPTVARIVAVMNRLVTFRLLGDPLGALINLTSGEVNTLIEANFSKSEVKKYYETIDDTKDWLFAYDVDSWKGTNWGLRTQMIALFNMIPDGMDVSRQLSKPALYANVRSKLMSPRAESEKILAIHIGLAVVMSDPIIHNGKELTIEDIYELNPITGIIQLKQEYMSLKDEWDPENGTKVRQKRKELMQKYTLLQGNFFRQNQSFASTTALGKAAEIMKRWFASGVVRHFQGEVIDPNLENPRKGHLLAFVHMIRALYRGVKSGDMAYIKDYFTVITKNPYEKLAIRKAYAEFIYILVFGILASVVLGYDDDDDDKNKKLREMAYLQQIAILLAVRVQSELGTFVPVPLWGLGYMEMKRAVLDPFGLPKTSVDNVMGIGALGVMQILSVFGVNYDKQLYYQKSKPYGYHFGGLGAFKDKGDSKLWAIMLNTIGYTGYTFEPAEYIKTLTQMQNRIK